MRRSMMIGKFKPKIVISIGIIVAALFIAFLYGLQKEQQRHLDRRFEQSLLTVEKFFQHEISERAKTLRLTFYELKNDDALKRLFIAKDRERLYEHAKPTFDRLLQEAEISHFYFHNLDKTNFLRVHQKNRFGDLITRQTLAGAAEKLDDFYGVEMGPLGTFTLRYVSPYFDRGELLGYLELGIEVSPIFDSIAHAAGVDLYTLIRKEHIATERNDRTLEWGEFQQVAIYGQTAHANDEFLHDLVPKVLNGADRTIFSTEGSYYYLGKLPLMDAAQREVGYLMVQGDYSRDLKHLDNIVSLMGGSAFVLGSLLVLMSCFYTSRMEKRIEHSQAQAEKETRARMDLQDQHIKELERVSLYDRITGLPNRSLLFELLKQHIVSANRVHKAFSLVLIDIKRMKEINDTLGYTAGDEVLRQVGERISDAVRRSDTVARVDADLFAVVMPTVGARLGILAAEKIHQIFARPFDIHNVPIDVDAQIGVAVYPDHADDEIALLQKADIAVSQSKSTYANYSLYSAEYDQYSRERILLFGELRRAITSSDGLQLYYQPKVDMLSRQVVGVEALMRWEHPERGFVSPVEFIQLAEQTGLIGALTEWVLAAAFSQAERWQKQGIDLFISVNLSAQNMSDNDLPLKLQALAEKHRVSPHKIMLEITETSIMDNVEKTRDVMNVIHQMGFRFSIDDFGTGYSSLVYLSQLPVSEIKVDQAFIFKMLENRSDAAIVKSTIDLGHGLGLSICSEGVENMDVWLQLDRWGNDIVQGYFIAKPMPAKQLELWLQSDFDKSEIHDAGDYMEYLA